MKSIEKVAAVVPASAACAWDPVSKAMWLAAKKGTTPVSVIPVSKAMAAIPITTSADANGVRGWPAHLTSLEKETLGLPM